MDNQKKNCSSRLKSVTELNVNYRYQLLFMLSMALYHSTDYFVISYEEKTHQTFLFTCFMDVDQFLWVLIFGFIQMLIVVHIISVTFILKSENFILQLLQKVYFPFQLYTAIKVFEEVFSTEPHKKFQNSLIKEQISRKTFGVIFFFGTMQIFAKFQSQYLHFDNQKQQGIIQKGMNRIYKFQFFVLLAKLVSNGIFVIVFGPQKVLYIISRVVFNIVLNAIFKYRVVFENPKIQYLYLLTQFYQWVPVTVLMLQYFQFWSQTIRFIEIIAFVLYLIMGLLKPSKFVKMLEEKYLVCLEVFDSGKVNMKSVEFSQNIIPVLSVIIQMFLQINQSIKWSDEFKGKFIQLIKQKVTKSIEEKGIVAYSRLYQLLSISEQNDQQKIIQNFSLAISEKKVFVSIENESEQINSTSKKQRKTCKKQHQIKQKMSQYFLNLTSTNVNLHKELFMELFWELIEKWFMSKDKQLKHIRYYLCYNMMDIGNVMKYRLMWCYYLSIEQEMSLLEKLEAEMCYNNLIQKMGRHWSIDHGIGFKQSNSHNKNHNYRLQNQASIFSMIKKTKIQTLLLEPDPSIFCLYSSPSFFNSKFNDIMQQNQILKSILRELRNFAQNQKLLSKIFENLKQNKEMIRQYYTKRRQRRKNVQGLIQSYSQLRLKNLLIESILNYIKQFFLRNNPLYASDQLKQAIECLIIEKSPLSKSCHLDYNNKCTEQNLNRRLLTNIRKSPLIISTENQHITCVVSAIQKPNMILIASSKFKSLMELPQEDKSNQSAFNHSLTSINSLILPLWRQRHLEIFSQNQTYERPINHQSKRYFMISKKGNVVIEVKFDVWFYVKEENDFMLILDMKYEQVEKIQIKGTDNTVVFSYGTAMYQGQFKQEVFWNDKEDQINQMNQRITSLKKDQERQKNQNQNRKPYEQINQVPFISKKVNFTRLRSQTVQLFDTRYILTIKMKELPQAKKTLESSNVTSVAHFDSFNSVSEKQLKQNYFRQMKFMKYKQQFNIYQKEWKLIKLIVISSIVFVYVFFQTFLTNNQQSKQDKLAIIRDKMSLQNQFITYDSYTVVDIGVLYKIVKGRIIFTEKQELQKKKFLSYVLTSLANVKQQILQKASQSQFDNRATVISNKLYTYDWIPGYNLSFMTHSLLNERIFYQTLALFIDFELLEGFAQQENQDDASSKISNRSLLQISKKLQSFNYRREVKKKGKYQRKENQVISESSIFINNIQQRKSVKRNLEEELFNYTQNNSTIDDQDNSTQLNGDEEGTNSTETAEKNEDKEDEEEEEEDEAEAEQKEEQDEEEGEIEGVDDEDEEQEDEEQKDEEQEDEEEDLVLVNLPSEFSQMEQVQVTAFLLQYLQSNIYYFGDSGVLNSVLEVQKLLFQEIESFRDFLMFVLQGGITAFTMAVVSIIIKMKSSILQNYNNVIGVSNDFIDRHERKTKQLQAQILKLSMTTQNSNFSLIHSSRLPVDHQQATTTSHQTKIDQSRSIHLNLPKYLFESVIFPFARYIVIFVIVSIVYSERVHDGKVLQRYSEALSELTKMNCNFIELMGINFFSQQNIRIFSQPEVVKVFTDVTSRLHQIDKTVMIDSIFPFHPESSHALLYQNATLVLQEWGQDIQKLSRFNSILQQSNSISKNAFNIFQHLMADEIDYEDFQSRFLQSYYQVNQFLYLCDKMTEKSYQMIEEHIKKDYSAVFIGLIVFLIIQFVLGVNHFNQIIDEFNEEYLNIASAEHLAKEQGFSYYVNRATHPHSISTATDHIESIS